ncbi:glutathione S-transferase family protein [Parvularcula sp. LCG005]|uniref:glutathione S-transferase family protein n=1 Tax=Parvularcula sp. LCG005 TaxID=3078805 RepID=UPI002942104D|nr:glutathione S-transferase family protein [Parvularcula sp. LCG005]WOI52643.1 glutathione S-transferase family protein [Parvularcula sp. LCG005]
MSLTLIIGNKNLSSWSFRPWILMTQFDIPFEEVMIRLDEPESRASIKTHSPSGLVPCLKDGDTAIWDSLAIAEYLSELYPDRHLWPQDKAARALARSMTCEMHSGFSALRGGWPMDIATKDAGVTVPWGVRRDLGRIFTLWTTARETHGSAGPFLFGAFSVADAFFAPVVSRIRSFGPVPTTPVVRDYLDAMEALPAFQKWADGALKEVADGWYTGEPIYS